VSEETSKRDLPTENETGQPNVEEPFMASQENQKKWSQLVTRAWADETLKQRLLSDPMPLLLEQGIEIPAGVEAHVVQDKDTISCMLQTQQLADGELTQGELSGVAGGTGKTKAASKGSSKQEYLVFAMSQVFVTST
jgi:hypothetical protein